MQVEFSEIENRASGKFRVKHWTKCHSKVYYEINHHSAIGWGVTIVCEGCRKRKNITDVGNW